MVRKKDTKSIPMPILHDTPEMVIAKRCEIDENKERGNWSSSIEFLLSCLSYAVGLGNVWKFPYLCYRNGGGAFLIPYTIMLLFVGLPLFFMELAFGQYASEGPITIWKISPLFQGLGYAMFLMSALVGVYYNMILAWAVFYLFSSFTSELPWTSCENEWNTYACRKFDTKNCTAHQGLMNENGRCIFEADVSPELWNHLKSSKFNTKTASDEYFHNFVLDITEGIHDLGGIRLELALCLFLCWFVIFFCLVRGVKSMGKVVYFTALFPYAVLLILLIRGLTLDGSLQGIAFYVTPDWERLKHVDVWKDAAMQIFFSLSPCWGGLITLASYNKFQNNCLKDALFIAFGNCGTSLFAGFVIFSIVGFMAHEMSRPVSEVAVQGAGLAFVVYPEAVSKLPLSPVWSFLFFSMLLTLGIGTQFTLIETVVTTIVDTWPKKLRHRKPLVLCAVCGIMYSFGLIICTKGGMYILQLMDDYCASFSALVIGLIEVIVITHIYGADNFLKNIQEMLGKPPIWRNYWFYVWKFICPLIIIFILVCSWYYAKPSSYGDVQFPGWTTKVGFLLTFISVSAIPIVGFIKIYNAKGPIIQRIYMLSRPTSEWGPKLNLHQNDPSVPKESDSQMPLTGQFEIDRFSNYSESDRSGDNDDHSDSDSGLKLTVKKSLQETEF